MKRPFFFAVILLLSSFALFSQVTENLVASESEMLKPKAVGNSDMLPVYPGDLAEGSYDIDCESSSSMFRIVKSNLSVKDNSMNVTITLSGKSYTKLFLGKAVEAAESNGKNEIPFEQNQQGLYTFSFQIPALNQEIDCAAFSSKKRKWYDRKILFSASSLPESALYVSPEKQQTVSLKNGTYKVNVLLSGGSGRASVISPCFIQVKEGLAVAEIEWSSQNYDYMKVNGVKYDADKKILDNGGNSTFLIPVFAFNKKMPVVADTLAMSQSHEIHYWLEFDLKSAKKTKKRK